ncbi:MAG: hypothetical protein J6Z43_11320 [Clostridiales bacterium]|nr:hypothetical protein [Clostridiales bacterium]
MGKKVIAIVSVIAVLIIGTAVLVFIPRDALIVTETSSFIFTNVNYYRTNPVLKIKLPCFSMSDDKLDAIKESRDTALQKAYEQVCEADEEAFRGEFTGVDHMVCELGDDIYYYRTSDVHNVYKLNKTTGEITASPLSGYNGFSSIEFRDSYEEVDHNFAAFVDIRTEALVAAYPRLKSAIDGVDGEFYYSYSYYDNGRVFFESGNTIYEYLPESDSVRKVVSVGAGETVTEVLDL